MSFTLNRDLTLEVVAVETFASLDGQGLPTYNTSADINARAVRKNELVTLGDGSQINTVLSVWVPPDAAVLPVEQDRLTFESIKFIVVQLKNVKGRDAVLVHRRLRCRREAPV